MEIGVSLACFYPRHPEDMIDTACGLGFGVSELFINTYSELQDDYIRKLRKNRRLPGLRIIPFIRLQAPLKITCSFPDMTGG